MTPKNTLSLNRKHIRSALISAILVSALVTFFVLASPRALQAQVPESVAACIPERIRKPVARVDNLSNYTFEKSTYYLFGLIEEGKPADSPPVLLVVKTTGQDDCHQVFFNPGGETVQLAQFMPQTVARRLTLGLYEHEIDQIGIDKFKADIAKFSGSGTSITWFDEEVWSLRQLGISIPSNVRIAPLPSPSTSQNP